MILTGAQIKQEVHDGTISIVPFKDDLINPNSYNYRLGNKLLVMDDEVLDVRVQPTTREITIPEEGYVLRQGITYLGFTVEAIGSTKFVPSLIGRSSLGRLGLFLQITADLGHIGTHHCWTLELKVVQPLRVYPNMRIGQVSFWKPDGLDSLQGKQYKEQRNSYAKFSGATPSNINKFFE